MALFYFVQLSLCSRSPCHNITQIILKSKQEFSGFVNFTFFSLFPYFSSKDDICFRHELGSAHVNFHCLNPQSSFYSLGRPKQVLGSIKFGTCKSCFSLIFVSINKSYFFLKFMALFYFVQLSLCSRSPCHNITQIILKSKQEFSGFVNFTFFSLFPYFSSKDDICFRHELGSAHVNFHCLNPQSSFYSLGRPKQVLGSIKFGTCKILRLNWA